MLKSIIKYLPFYLIAIFTTLIVIVYVIDDPKTSTTVTQKEQPPKIAPDFYLEHSSGNKRLSDYKGKLVLLFFGYLSCPDICPTTMADVSSAINTLAPEEQSQVQVFFVSVDPERDKTDGLDEYARFFHPSILAVTGEPITLKQVTQSYGVYFAKTKTDSALGYLVDHTASVFVITKKGELAEKIPYGKSSVEIAERIRHFL